VSARGERVVSALARRSQAGGGIVVGHLQSGSNTVTRTGAPVVSNQWWPISIRNSNTGRAVATNATRAPGAR